MIGLGVGGFQVSLAGDFDRLEGVRGEMPEVGESAARWLTPQILELGRITTSDTNGSVDAWDFVEGGNFVAPEANSCVVEVDGQSVSCSITGFRRRVLYAPLGETDLRVENRLYLTLSSAASDGAEVKVTTDGWEGESSIAEYAAVFDGDRRSPAVHVNQEGYETVGPKQAMVGYYLGSGGEMAVAATSFSVVDEASGLVVFSGPLTLRQDVGYTYSPPPYQQVWQADFSSWETPGEYRLKVEGLGVSLPFRIADNMLLGFARTYAQGLYNQRCGHAVELPFSRHPHAACHTALAGVPTSGAEFDDTWGFIAQGSADSAQVAPQMVSPETQLYPILRSGPIDVSGGHHDAGDYSKYTINSAQLIHHLAFIVDAAPAAGALDNLGIPESGDGKSDLLQEAKIEADFLAKMQDDDGGFFFLVYPKHRKYEDDVLPEDGDEQVVWPKNTASTAAAVGALADLGSSPLFQQQFPSEAALYLQKAAAGWQFLLEAIEEHGLEGSYQKITHYGHIFGHDDELAWAASAMFAATGNPVCLQKLKEWYDPTSTDVRRWGWWALFEGYGCATRDYLFAQRVGKRSAGEMDAAYLADQEALQMDTGTWLTTLSGQGAYGSCLDPYSKQQSTAGWFFCSERAFEITVTDLLVADPAHRTAVVGNANYEMGCNPVNVSYVTGSGWRRQREIVHQYAQNDDRVLPPSGIPLGNIQTGFSWVARYGSVLGSLSYPGDGLSTGKYPFYDRWGDAFNSTTEFVIAQQGRGLASLARWGAQSPGAATPWTSATPEILLPGDYVSAGDAVTAEVSCPGMDLSAARVTWEWGGVDPWIGGSEFTFTPHRVARHRIEAEVVMPDGRRFSAARWFGVKGASGGAPWEVAADTIALYHFDDDFTDATAHGFDLTAQGDVERVEHAAGWMAEPSGRAVRFHGMGDQLTAVIPASYITPENAPTPLVLEAWICPLSYEAYGQGSSPLMALVRSWNSKFGALQDIWVQPAAPFLITDGLTLVSGSAWEAAVRPGEWQHLRICRTAAGEYEAQLDGVTVGSGQSTAGPFGPSGEWTLTLGNFNGYLDEVRITGDATVLPPEEEEPEDGGGPGPGSGSGGTGGGANADVIPFAVPLMTDADTVALYHFDGDFQDASGQGYDLVAAGGATRVASFDANGLPAGERLRLSAYGDSLSVTFPDSQIAPGSVSQPLTLETWIYPRAYKVYGNGTNGNFSLKQNWDSSLAISEDKWLQPAVPSVSAGSTTLLPQGSWESLVSLETWHHLMLTRDETGVVTFWVDGEAVASAYAPINYGRTTDWTFRIADIDADFDEVRISRVVRTPPAPDGFEVDAETIALYHFNGNFEDSGPNGLHLTSQGGANRAADNLGWMTQPVGEAARFGLVGDQLMVTIPDALLSPGNAPPELTLEAWIYPRAYKAYGVATSSIFRLEQNWDSSLGVMQDKWLLPDRPKVMVGSHTALAHDQWDAAVMMGQWQHLKITHNAQSQVDVWVDGVLISSQSAPFAYSRTNDWTFVIGNIDADFDEVRISQGIR
ncbi:glycoside hydrolase family 9 protein [Haloferula luteola]|nr:glycoside hydrolase family 9 protein [Haloferula luteola]